MGLIDSITDAVGDVFGFPTGEDYDRMERQFRANQELFNEDMERRRQELTEELSQKHNELLAKSKKKTADTRAKTLQENIKYKSQRLGLKKEAAGLHASVAEGGGVGEKRALMIRNKFKKRRRAAKLLQRPI